MRSLSCGVAKKIPLGFLKEEIPELKTGTGMSLPGKWARDECVRGAVTHAERMTGVDDHVLKSMDSGSAPPGHSCRLLRVAGGQCGVWVEEPGRAGGASW